MLSGAVGRPGTVPAETHRLLLPALVEVDGAELPGVDALPASVADVAVGANGVAVSPDGALRVAALVIE
ncbi:MAG: hypothetical protein AAB412_04475, partial [Elusimicrobiota bacterium]